MDTATRRKALSARLVAHREDALRYIAAYLVERACTAPVSDEGKPELLQVALPSRLAGAASPRSSFWQAAESERVLRRATCLKALQSVRAVVIQRAHLLKKKNKHTKGIIGVTRAEGLIARLGDRLQHARWEYSSSRLQLISLGLTEQDARTFRALTDQDLKGLTAALEGKDRLGDGHATMPWYWRVELSSCDEDAEQVSTSGKAVRAEYEESESRCNTRGINLRGCVGVRVEWFRARERSRRWEEEVLWLQREAATVIIDYSVRASQWLEKSTHGPPGVRAYSCKQSAMWTTLSESARTKLMTMLTVRHG